MNVAAIVSLGVLGSVFGVILAFAAKKLAVETDPREAQILGVLPGANCGGCGFPGCAAYASAVISGKAPVDKCPVGGATVASKVGEIMGVAVDSSVVRRYARVRCQGDKDACGLRFEYDGVQDCRAANMVAGGPKQCSFGCLGFGTCVSACPFDAIRMTEAGLPEVDRDKCTACGRCVEACPRGLIQLLDEDITVYVACCSTNKGADVRKVCKVGCIGCGICAKNCPAGAITVTSFLARVDQEKCTGCGVCAEKCPMKCIVLEKPSQGAVSPGSVSSAAVSSETHTA